MCKVISNMHFQNENVEILNKKDKQQAKTKSKRITLQLMMLQNLFHSWYNSTFAVFIHILDNCII